MTLKLLPLLREHYIVSTIGKIVTLYYRKKPKKCRIWGLNSRYRANLLP